ncbi:hypothetical protein ANN_06775 [Periplaneta americana]|uniref:Uncharacterized protein n=1 Tax=Periplaneta americana TaxID=6978 RepID=A0ABQ8TG63_PERAM|nr:hypothetical protein ANN_06775 [Periplaneta americana]
MSPGSSNESYPAFAHIGLRENPGKNLNQVTCPDRESNPGHLVSRPDSLTVTLQVSTLLPPNLKSMIRIPWNASNIAASFEMGVDSIMGTTLVRKIKFLGHIMEKEVSAIGKKCLQFLRDRNLKSNWLEDLKNKERYHREGYLPSLRHGRRRVPYSLLLECQVTDNTRKKWINDTILNTNRYVAYNKICNITNIRELNKLGKFLIIMKTKWEKKVNSNEQLTDRPLEIEISETTAGSDLTNSAVPASSAAEETVNAHSESTTSVMSLSSEI